MPAGHKVDVDIPSVCLNFGLPTPTPRDRFRLVDVDDYSKDPRVRKALRCLAGLGTSHGTAQAAMWRVCNNVPFELMLTKGDKDTSQPWQNPETGARGSVTPLAQAYANGDGRTCRDFLASYVNGRTESWLQGAACQAGHGRWEIHTLKPWKRG